eukprot:Hpha_TRINITY_DN4860_c0_g1::TRINITY_DN4860_c0_g1_i1::g.20392::m.20392
MTRAQLVLLGVASAFLTPSGATAGFQHRASVLGPAGPKPTVLPEPDGGHQGWIMFMSEEGLHKVDADGNETTTILKWADTSVGRDVVKNCKPTGMAVDEEYDILLWSCGKSLDPMPRKVYRCHYAWNPPTVDAVVFADDATPGLRAGVAIDKPLHKAFVAIHGDRGWRVQAFPLKGCDELYKEADCKARANEGCSWAGVCIRAGSGTDILQAKTDGWLDGGGLTFHSGALWLSYFNANSNAAMLMKKKEDGTGRQTTLGSLEDFWIDEDLTAGQEYYIGAVVATHDMEPDEWLYLAAVKEGKAQLYRADPSDTKNPELIWEFENTPWYAPGTPGVTPMLNEGGSPQPAFAMLWEQQNMVFCTGKDIQRWDGDFSQKVLKSKKTLVTSSGKMGILGPVVWYRNRLLPPTAGPTLSPLAPTQPPIPGAVPPSVSPSASPNNNTTPGGTPTASPVVGGGGTTPPNTTIPNGTTPTLSPVVAPTLSPAGPPVPSVSPTASPTEKESDPMILTLIIIGLVLLCCGIAIFLYWYLVKSKADTQRQLDELKKPSPVDERGEPEAHAHLSEIAMEALPVSAEELSVPADRFRHTAGAHLKQLRNGEYLHDPAEDYHHPADELQRMVEEQDQRHLREEEQKRHAVDWVATDILAKLGGDEVDNAVEQWLGVQDEDPHHPELEWNGTSPLMTVPRTGSAIQTPSQERHRGFGSTGRGARRTVAHIPAYQGHSSQVHPGASIPYGTVRHPRFHTQSHHHVTPPHRTVNESMQSLDSANSILAHRLARRRASISHEWSPTSATTAPDAPAFRPIGYGSHTTSALDRTPHQPHGYGSHTTSALDRHPQPHSAARGHRSVRHGNSPRGHPRTGTVVFASQKPASRPL